MQIKLKLETPYVCVKSAASFKYAIVNTKIRRIVSLHVSRDMADAIVNAVKYVDFRFTDEYVVREIYEGETE